MVEIKSNGSSGGLAEDCQREFKTKDLYAVLNLDKDKATPAEIKKAYYKFSLKYHPDKAASKENEEENKIKFQILGKVYSILSNEESRKLYDECGAIEGEDTLFSDIQDWTKYWRQMFKKITKSDIADFYKKYRESDEEREDLFKLYAKHEGSMELILQEMFSEDLLEDEPRFRDMLSQAIEEKKLDKFDAFVNESAKKANKRKAKLEKEAKEAEVMRKELGIDESQNSLRNAILNKKKENSSDNFLEHLASKYAGKGKSKPAAAKAKGKATTASAKKSKRGHVEEDDEEEEDEDDDADDLAEVDEDEDDSDEEEEEEDEDEKPSKSKKSRAASAKQTAPAKRSTRSSAAAATAAPARVSTGKGRRVKRL